MPPSSNAQDMPDSTREGIGSSCGPVSDRYNGPKVHVARIDGLRRTRASPQGTASISGFLAPASSLQLRSPSPADSGVSSEQRRSSTFPSASANRSEER